MPRTKRPELRIVQMLTEWLYFWGSCDTAVCRTVFGNIDRTQ